MFQISGFCTVKHIATQKDIRIVETCNILQNIIFCDEQRSKLSGTSQGLIFWGKYPFNPLFLNSKQVVVFQEQKKTRNKLCNVIIKTLHEVTIKNNLENRISLFNDYFRIYPHLGVFILRFYNI